MSAPDDPHIVLIDSLAEPSVLIVGLAVVMLVGSALVFAWLHGYGRGHAAASRNTRLAVAEAVADARRSLLAAVRTKADEIAAQLDAIVAPNAPSRPGDDSA